MLISLYICQKLLQANVKGIFDRLNVCLWTSSFIGIKIMFKCNMTFSIIYIIPFTRTFFFFSNSVISTFLVLNVFGNFRDITHVMKKSESENISHSVTSDSETSSTIACQVPLSRGIFQARILEWLAIPITGIKTRSPTLQADSLLSVSPGKPCHKKVIHNHMVEFLRFGVIWNSGEKRFYSVLN